VGENNSDVRPSREYVEVVDSTPASDAFLNEPVNLNSPELLAQDGFAPSEEIPQFFFFIFFHAIIPNQQYGLRDSAMTTIRNFDARFGRRILWARTAVAQ